MKRVVVYFSIVVTMFLFCGCDFEVDNVQQSTTIIGRWRWISTMKVIPFSDTNPATPLNTCINESLIFQEDGCWKKIENDILVDSGSFTIGHVVYINQSNVKCDYDSLGYYVNKIPVVDGVDFFKINNDTLVFCSYFACRWTSYTLKHAGTKRWVKVN